MKGVTTMRDTIRDTIRDAKRDSKRESERESMNSMRDSEDDRVRMKGVTTSIPNPISHRISPMKS